MSADMQIYLVGGAVRDQLLGRAFTERDWVVTGATPARMLAEGYTQIDPAFPVFRHPETNEEYALARRELKQGAGYKGFSVEFGPDITLQEDLKRRDLTINAMAMDDHGQLIDPFDGRQDLQDGWLRHVSPAFVEDPFRLVRIARFAAELGNAGFRVKHETFKLMKAMARTEELQSLSRERFVREMYKALRATQPWPFFKLLGKAGALDRLLPGLNVWINGDQMQHGVDALPIQRLQRLSALTNDPDTRLAGLLAEAVLDGGYDLGSSLPLPKKLLQLVGCLQRLSALISENSTADDWLSSLMACGAGRQPERLEQSVLLMEQSGRMPAQITIHELLNQLAAIKVSEWQDQGLQGKALGEALQSRRLETVQRWLENQR